MVTEAWQLAEKRSRFHSTVSNDTCDSVNKSTRVYAPEKTRFANQKK